MRGATVRATARPCPAANASVRDGTWSIIDGTWSIIDRTWSIMVHVDTRPRCSGCNGRVARLGMLQPSTGVAAPEEIMRRWREGRRPGGSLCGEARVGGGAKGLLYLGCRSRASASQLHLGSINAASHPVGSQPNLRRCRQGCAPPQKISTGEVFPSSTARHDPTIGARGGLAGWPNTRLAARTSCEDPMSSAHDATSAALSLSSSRSSRCSQICSSRVIWYALANTIKSSACSAGVGSGTSSVSR
mmetsp:Transcript_18449/g.60358  ORF Transcript_18449/g.60358 Transcript_18449/m.60358 type:complete len:246 (-) Transcript_18449:1247-1984(-)